MTERPGFTDNPVWEFQKYDGWLVAGEREYMGRSFFEFRFWAGERGEKATSKGVTIPLDAVPDMAAAVCSYAAKLSAGDSRGGD